MPHHNCESLRNECRAESAILPCNLSGVAPGLILMDAALRCRVQSMLNTSAGAASRPIASTLICLLILTLGPAPALAQSPITFQYIYDDLNQLTKVIDSTGVVIQYVYDPVGNILQINRSTVQPGVLTLFNI